MKRILTVLITFLMVIALGVTASAEDLEPLKPENSNDYFTIKVNNNMCDYRYEVYQIFKGKPAVNANGTRYLADIEWGDGMRVAELTAALKAGFSGFEDASTAADYAKAMLGVQRQDHLAEVIAKYTEPTKAKALGNMHSYKNNDTDAIVIADKITHITEAGNTIVVGEGTGKYTEINHVGYYINVPVEDAGYYLLKNTVVKEGEPGSRVIMSVVGDVNVDPKLLSAPSFRKTVGGINESKTATPYKGYDMNDSYEQIMAKYTSWQTTADHDIGDVVPYRLSITLPEDPTFDTINDYVIEIIDTMSPGLDFDKDSLKLFYGYSDEATKNTHYVALNNMQWLTLEDYLKYSNLKMDDNHNYVERADSEKITLGDSDTIFYNLLASLNNSDVDSLKTSKINKKVEGSDAETIKKRTVWYEYTQGNGSSNSILRIGSASIDNVASLIDAPEKASKHIHIFYECKLNDKAVVGTDEHNKDGNPNTAYLKYSSNDHTLTNTTPVKNEVYTYQLNIKKVDDSSKELKGADFELLKFYKELKPAEGTKYYAGSASDYTIGNTSTKITAPANAPTVQNVWVVVNPKTANTKDSNGQFTNSIFNYVGIDNGRYMLRETATPAGYNSLKKPIVFDIETETSETDSLNPILMKFNVILVDGPTGVGFSVADNTVKVVQGIASANIVNKKGVQLPSTGGMGTTLFYIAGAALIVAASITMIVKKQEKE